MTVAFPILSWLDPAEGLSWAALGPWVAPVNVTSVREFRVALRATQADCFVLHLGCLARDTDVVSFTAALSERPGMVALVRSDLRREHLQILLRLARVTTVEVSIIGQDRLEADVRRLLRRSPVIAARSSIRQVLVDQVCGPVVDLVQWSMQHVGEARDHGSSLALALGMPVRRLRHRVQEHGIPSLRTLVRWSRLLLVEALLVESTLPVETVAATCGFSDGSALRHALARAGGFTTKALQSGDETYPVARRFAQHFPAIYCRTCQGAGGR